MCGRPSWGGLWGVGSRESVIAERRRARRSAVGVHVTPRDAGEVELAQGVPKARISDNERKRGEKEMAELQGGTVGAGNQFGATSCSQAEAQLLGSDGHPGDPAARTRCR
jgi:hypothetical protein